MAKEKKAYRSAALKSLHETMEDLKSVGAIDAPAMKDFDKKCLKPQKK